MYIYKCIYLCLYIFVKEFFCVENLILYYELESMGIFGDWINCVCTGLGAYNIRLLFISMIGFKWFLWW